jgi:hypothetical protein
MERQMSELGLDWGKSSAPPPKQSKAAKLKAVVNVSIFTMDKHKCEAAHKTTKTFIECALRVYRENISKKLALPTISVKGSGSWATIHASESDSYYTHANNKELNHQHELLEVILFETLEEAAEWQKFQIRFCKSSTGCSNDCNGKGMHGYVTKIVL